MFNFNNATCRLQSVSVIKIEKTMKTLFLSISFGLLAIALACSKKEIVNDNSQFPFGDWKEFEALSDPGDGSGVFRKVDGAMLTINPDSSYTCTPEHYFWGSGGRILSSNDSAITIYRSQSLVTLPAIVKKKNNIVEVFTIVLKLVAADLKK